MTSYSKDLKSWLDGKGHCYGVMNGEHGWIVTVHPLNADGTLGEMTGGGDRDYPTEDEAWAAAKARAGRSAADTQAY